MRIRTARYAGLIILLWCILAGNLAQAQFGLFKKKKNEPKRTVSIYEVDTLIDKMIPTQRQIFHQRIDKEQRRADVSDGSVDNMIFYTEDTALTNSLTRSIIRDIDHLQVMIENIIVPGDPSIGTQMKIRYLSAVLEMMRNYNMDMRVDPVYYRRLVTNMRDFIIASHENKLDDFVRSQTNIYTLDNSTKLLEERADLRSHIFSVIGREQPRVMIKRLNEFATEPYACDVIAAAARVTPNEVLNYATSTNMPLRNAVVNCSDPLVQSIVLISNESHHPLKTISFLGDIHNQKMTVDEADKIAGDKDLYFQNLVRLKIENDTLGKAAYINELAYRSLSYVRDMNDLHDSPDPVRFKGIEGFPPETLYYIMIYGQDEIYTSSFLGTFNRMLERMKPMKGDEFLAKIRYDRFRTFIRMTAGYNTLSNFLATMEPDKKSDLMSNFIAGLSNGAPDELEDAVDVADAFGSIRDSSLALFLKNKVRENYEEAARIRSRKGMIVYALLAVLFESSKASSSEDEIIKQSQALSLPPINLVPYSSLVNDSGIVYEQFFFYGDEDGKASYNSFMGNFRDGKWKTETSKYWVTITSTQGKKIVVYANLPLDEPGDEEAQKKLAEHLNNLEIKPTFIVHRGHSYHLPLTLDRLSKENKVVMLGSCGGYHNLAVVLDHAPDAHIISSKQTGMMVINEPIIKEINDNLLAGKDINWINVWSEVSKKMKGKDIKEKFDDYVPPYKNLGAIFIKSYRKLTIDLAAI